LEIANETIVPLGLRDKIRSLEEKYTPHLCMEMLEDIREWTMADVLAKKERLEAYEEKESYT
jgi:hypothetical protein